TLYESKYKNYLGDEFDTRYNGSYAANGILRKEFKVGKSRQHWLGISARLIYTGGMRYLPEDLELSIARGESVRILDYGYTEKADDYFRMDLQIIFRRNKPKYTSEWRVDIMNLTNHKNMLYRRYNDISHSIETEYQNPIIPVLSYRIQF
ncbi:MAG: TonB-dependent receptor, partial [Bacteroidota bacterium]